MLARQFGKQHHADEKQADIQGFGSRSGRLMQGHQPQTKQQQYAAANPINFGKVARADEHQQDAYADDPREEKVQCGQG
jgi:hypothetical protein